jgi:hypothetical protein
METIGDIGKRENFHSPPLEYAGPDPPEHAPRSPAFENDRIVSNSIEQLSQQQT